MKILLALTVLASLLLLANAARTNYMKDYCGKKIYFGNPGNRYPHLHCGSSFVTLSLGSANHKYLTKSGQIKCNTVQEVLNDINAGEILENTNQNVREPIIVALERIMECECSKLDQLLQFLI